MELDEEPVEPLVPELLELPVEPELLGLVDCEPLDEPMPEDEPEEEWLGTAESDAPEAELPVEPEVPELLVAFAGDALLPEESTVPVAVPEVLPIPEAEPDAVPLAPVPLLAQAASIRAQARGNKRLCMMSSFFQLQNRLQKFLW